MKAVYKFLAVVVIAGVFLWGIYEPATPEFDYGRADAEQIHTQQQLRAQQKALIDVQKVRD